MDIQTDNDRTSAQGSDPNECSIPGWQEIALKEYEILQQKIGDWGKTVFTIRGWLITLIGGLTVALLTEKLPPFGFFVISVLIILPLLFSELVELAWQRKAITRAAEVETALREGRGYKGPAIGAELSTSAKWGAMFREFPKPLVSVFYVGLVVAVVAISVSLAAAGPRAASPNPAAGGTGR
jgi:hypothetical protein